MLIYVLDRFFDHAVYQLKDLHLSLQLCKKVDRSMRLTRLTLDKHDLSKIVKFTNFYNFHFQSCKFADVDDRLTVLDLSVLYLIIYIFTAFKLKRYILYISLLYINKRKFSSYISYFVVKLKLISRLKERSLTLIMQRLETNNLLVRF